MALTSTLFTGLSGLDVNQTRLNVVGNNIANVNTVGFKSSRALFKPQFYVTDSAGSPSSSEFGGTNPSQRGLGASVSAIEKDFSAGQIEPTGKPTDMAIDGDGFFIVQGNEQNFTRDGSFTLNANNDLVTQTGEFVQGFGVDDDNNVITGPLQNVTIPLGTSTTAEATENVVLQGNLNADGSIGTGSSILNSQAMTTISTGLPIDATTALTDVTDPTATPLFTNGQVFTLSGKKGGRTTPDKTFTVGTDGTTVADLTNFFNESLGIDTTVTAGGITPGVTIDGTGRMVVTGNVGTDNALEMSASSFQDDTGFSPFVFADDPTSNPSGESAHTTLRVYDSLGTPVDVDVNMVLESKSDTGTSWRVYASSGDTTGASTIVGNAVVEFDTSGQLLTSTNSSLAIEREDTGAASPLNIRLDLSKMTALTDDNSVVRMEAQDGKEIGTLTSFSIGADGTVTGAYTNGQTQTLGQVAIATFKNQMGLEDIGGNLYRTGSSSGIPVVSSPLTLGSGGVRSGALELSNVDLSTEFINLIISSTGFSASSRVITTSDQLITELLNASR